MVPPAPVVFSTNMDCPSACRMGSLMMRASVSVGPPAANGTTSVIGFDGNPWAAAVVVPRAAMSAQPAASVFTTPPFRGCAPFLQELRRAVDGNGDALGAEGMLERLVAAGDGGTAGGALAVGRDAVAIDAVP